MDMHEWSSSHTARRGRPVGPAVGQSGPAAARIVELGASGRVAAVGEREDMTPRPAAAGRGPAGATAPTSSGTGLDLGPMRGGGHRGSTAGTTGAEWRPVARSTPAPRPPITVYSEIEVTLSAEIAAEIGVGATARVPFQIELSREALSLAVSHEARARTDQPIIVSLSVENDTVEIVRGHEFTVDPPAPGQPRAGFFTVKGRALGAARLAVAFRQGGSVLGVIALAAELVRVAASGEKASGRAVAAPRDEADDDKLALLIEQRTEVKVTGEVEVYYEYTLHSEALGLAYRRVRSKALLDRGGGPANTAQAFVERIYERVTRELKSFDDLKELQREARALGVSLCRELFDPAVAKMLWPLRDRLRVIQVVSWEPYIPWEMVRLCDPESDAVDERFLCEYGLVRTLSDEMPARTLAMNRWAYLGATFPMGSFPAVGAELSYFTGSSADSLRGRGITPTAIPATRDAFYDELAEGDADVLHISCHAESTHESIDRACLIIGDETPPCDTKPRLVEVNTDTVAAEARLKPRRPLVFLNACETGRIGAVLTAWGGWPNVFLRKGAGAFVGAAWAVRDKPAAAFSTAFYNALLGGANLADAASAGRAAAKKLGDASWLAFKVYGHPRARRAG